jgi:hypothetical protein
VRRLEGGVTEVRRERDGYAVGRGGATLGRDGGLILGVAHYDEGEALRGSQGEFEELVDIVIINSLRQTFCCRGEASVIPVVRSFGRSFGHSVCRSPLVAREPIALLCKKKNTTQKRYFTVTSQLSHVTLALVYVTPSHPSQNFIQKVFNPLLSLLN